MKFIKNFWSTIASYALYILAITAMQKINGFLLFMPIANFWHVLRLLVFIVVCYYSARLIIWLALTLTVIITPLSPKERITLFSAFSVFIFIITIVASLITIASMFSSNDFSKLLSFVVVLLIPSLMYAFKIAKFSNKLRELHSQDA